MTAEERSQKELELSNLYMKKGNSKTVMDYVGSILTENFLNLTFLAETPQGRDPSDPNTLWTVTTINNENQNAFRLDRFAFETCVNAMKAQMQPIVDEYQRQIDVLTAELNA